MGVVRVWQWAESAGGELHNLPPGFVEMGVSSGCGHRLQRAGHVDGEETGERRGMEGRSRGDQS